MFNRNEIHNPNALPSRVHYAWHQLEEYYPDGGMWRTVSNALDRDRLAKAAAELMAKPPAFAYSMRLALKKWPRSVEVALTTPGLNQRAWLGHAGCYLLTTSPEDVTRIGWHMLDAGEQFAANDAADMVIAEWRKAQNADIEQLILGGFDA